MSKRKEANRKVAEAEALAEKAGTCWCLLDLKPFSQNPKTRKATLSRLVMRLGKLGGWWKADLWKS